MRNLRHSSQRFSDLTAYVSILSFSLLGCGESSGPGRPKLAPVSGVIKFQGKPVANADVTFAGEGSPRFATARTDAEGKFALTTFDTNDGAVPGKHAITIAASPTGGKKPEEMTAQDMINMGPRNPTAEGTLPAKYADPKTSGLSRTVVEGEPNTFTIDLE